MKHGARVQYSRNIHRDRHFKTKPRDGSAGEESQKNISLIQFETGFDLGLHLTVNKHPFNVFFKNQFVSQRRDYFHFYFNSNILTTQHGNAFLITLTHKASGQSDSAADISELNDLYSETTETAFGLWGENFSPIQSQTLIPWLSWGLFVFSVIEKPCGRHMYYCTCAHLLHRVPGAKCLLYGLFIVYIVYVFERWHNLWVCVPEVHHVHTGWVWSCTAAVLKCLLCFMATWGQQRRRLVWWQEVSISSS